MSEKQRLIAIFEQVKVGKVIKEKFPKNTRFYLCPENIKTKAVATVSQIPILKKIKEENFMVIKYYFENPSTNDNRQCGQILILASQIALTEFIDNHPIFNPTTKK